MQSVSRAEQPAAAQAGEHAAEDATRPTPPARPRRSGPSGDANGSKTLLAKAMAVSKAKLARPIRLGPQITNGFYDPTDIYSDAGLLGERA